MAEELERGHVFFCYRPRVDVGRARGPADVQRFYMIVRPDRRAVFRRIIIGRKRLPDPRAHERTWGLVDLVTGDPERLEDELDPRQYRTKIRGPRTEPPGRPAGEGIYAIVRHVNHTHLAYGLELPASPGPVQRDLDIAREASFVVMVKNPDVGPPTGLGPRGSRKPAYPPRLRAEFSGRRFIELDPPELLDHPGAEIVLVGAALDVGRELGITFDPEHETPESAAFFSELGLERDVHPLAPLLTGDWA